MKSNIFLLCGKTGGPFFPYFALSEILQKNYNLIFLGVRDSFESKISQRSNLKIEYLPEVKLSLVSFNNLNTKEIIIEIRNTFFNFFGLLISFLKAFILIIKYKPTAIITTGSFLNVPVFCAARIFRFFGLKLKLIVHQQDPQPGLANRFASKFSDYLTCTFEFTKKSYPAFRSAKVIPNPIKTNSYTLSKTENLKKIKLENEILAKFIRTSKKPILLVFGGGSGSKKINDWVVTEIKNLTKKYRVIHLSGTLRTNFQLQVQDSNYFSLPAVFDSMPNLLSVSDLVIARSGLGTITELQFLDKPAYLTPLPNSHQETNANLVADSKLRILQEKDVNNWAKIILDRNIKKEINTQNQKEIDEKLQIYYRDLKKIILSKI